MSNKYQQDTLLEVQDLKTYFFTEDGVVKAVDGIDLVVKRGEVLGLVGESGCGKSVTSLSILRLIGQPGEIIQGKVFFDDRNLFELSESEMVKIRGNRISMVFQQPITSLNPVFSVGEQISEVLRIHTMADKESAWNRAVELLERMGIADAESKARAFPHELSGGQAQRVMIAMALATVPELLIADEPTTALDVTIQAQILDLLRDLRTNLETSIILITHDLGVIAEMVDRMYVMYAGRIVEEADVTTIFDRPQHPYTKGLIASIPVLGMVKDKLEVIPGTVPNLIDLPPGCRFAPRCRSRVEYGLHICTEEEPDLIEFAPQHTVRCWLFQSRGDHHAPLSTSMSPRS